MSRPQPSPVDRSTSERPAGDQTCQGGRYCGFSLKSVCWGYREVFAEAIEALFAAGLLGPEHEQVTLQFFALLKRADQRCFDHVLRQFLGALRPENHWIMELPGVFADLTELGARLGEAKTYYGTRYFETLAQGGFGNTPRQVRACLNWMRRLLEIDSDLGLAFLKGYRRLVDRLLPQEINRYVKEGIEVFHRRKESGLRFLSGELQASEAYLSFITQECRLVDVKAALERLLRALAGAKVEVSDLGELDADELLAHNTKMLCLHGHLYLPARFRHFGRASLNRKWYLLSAVVAAGMLVDKSFPLLHGHPDYPACQDLLGTQLLAVNLFHVVEYVRTLRRIALRWPGAKRLIAFGLRTEFEAAPPSCDAEKLFRDAMDGSVNTPAVCALREEADASVNCLDTAARIRRDWVGQVLASYPGLDRLPLRAFAFLSDFAFPVTFSAPPRDGLVADLRDECARSGDSERSSGLAADAGPPDGAEGAAAPGEGGEVQAAVACYVYDEWNCHENEYYHDHCMLREVCPERRGGLHLPGDLAEQARGVRAMFERLKPDLARRAKRLPDGEAINPDLLLDYIVERHREPAPRVRFYEKPLLRQRDWAVLILLDVSGSTGEDLAGEVRAIDVEKQAGIILGQGLAALGDRFAICGFTSDGRENCQYYVYKDFDETWSSDAVGSVLGAWPSGSTRIGPALRHSGYRLCHQPCRRRLILLVTDGKPMDRDYDPNTRYAQYDVRMACEENASQDIYTFAISTTDNSEADMEIMFPHHRYAILSDIRDLPRLLPKLYIRLTT